MQPDPAMADTSNAGQYHAFNERSIAATEGRSEYERAHQWREATRELVLASATAMVAADPRPSQCSISITLIGNALSNDLLLADTGTIVLTSLRDHAHARSHPMRVLPMRLDMLSDPPTIRLLGRGVTQPTRLWLVVELTARNPRTCTASVMRCEYESVLLDAETPLAVVDFQLQHHTSSDHADPRNSSHQARHHQRGPQGADDTKRAPFDLSVPEDPSL